jgi:hypothetical protein
MKYVKAFDKPFFDGTLNNEGKPEGEGTYYKSDRFLVGKFHNGVLNGYGKKYYNGYKDEGMFKDDELNGKGKRTDPAGNIMEGNFVNGLLEGQGIKKMKDGAYVKGNFVQGRLEGAGEKKTADYLYVGNFKNGKFDGEGKYYWLNDSSKWFKGYFNSGKRSGIGEFHISDTLNVSGFWANDCPNDSVYLNIYSEKQQAYLKLGVWYITECKVRYKSMLDIVFDVREEDVLQRLKED